MKKFDNKSYTSLKQSEVLGEILPLESADMCYRCFVYNPDGTPDVYLPFCVVGTLESDIPCWSLAALLEIIRNNGIYELRMWEGGYYFEENEFITESYLNPIDTCYEMIIELHKRKKL